MRAGRAWIVALCCGVCLLSPAAIANQLEQVYQRALANDASFAAAQAALRADREAWPQARASVLPRLSASADISEIGRDVEETPFSDRAGGGGGGPRAPFSDDFRSDEYRVELRQPLFDWGIPARLRQGRTQVERAKIELGIQRKLLLARVITRYLDFLAAAEQLSFARAEKKALAGDLDRAQARYDVGETGVTGLREAQAAADLASARLIDARTALDEARENLREITDVWYETLPGISGEIPLEIPDPEDPDAWVAIAYDHNGRYLQAQRDVRLAADEIPDRRGNLLPQLDLVASYTELDDTEYVFGSASEDQAIGLQATWQLFDGGRSLSQVREARARHDQRQSELQATANQVARETRNAYRQVRRNLDRVRALSQAVTSARTALKATVTGFEVGERVQADVLDARRDLFRALSDAASARYDYLSSVMELRLIAGILSIEDLQRLDRRMTGQSLPASATASMSEAVRE